MKSDFDESAAAAGMVKKELCLQINPLAQIRA